MSFYCQSNATAPHEKTHFNAVINYKNEKTLKLWFQKFLFSINKYLYCLTAQILYYTRYFQFLPDMTLMVVSHVGGLIFSICVIWQSDLGLWEVVALQVAENHLDLKNNMYTQTVADVYKASLNLYTTNKYTYLESSCL